MPYNASLDVPIVNYFVNVIWKPLLLDPLHFLLTSTCEYSCSKLQVVIANLLDTRKFEVVLVTRKSQQTIKMTSEDLNAGLEIEENIVKELVDRHSQFCSS